ncbi:MAG: hypothetical protein RJA49_2772 [Actinomycetota bacterium]|jgi:crossover junction endodeoxyribonuclease RuvC
MSGGYFAGIDPGVDGALAVVDARGRIVDITSMPTLNDGPRGRRRVHAAGIAAVLRRWPTSDLRIAVEVVGVRPGEGAGGAFAFGRGVGAIEGVIAALAIPSQGVLPVVWKRAHTIPAKSGKDVSRSRAAALWPTDDCHFAAKAEGGYGPIAAVEGRAEAALIAEWLRLWSANWPQPATVVTVTNVTGQWTAEGAAS